MQARSYCASAPLALLLAASPAVAGIKIETPVVEELAKDDSARVIIVTRADPEAPGGGPAVAAPQAYVAQSLGMGAGAIKRVGTLRAVVANISTDHLERLKSDPNVEAVFADIPVAPATDVSVRLVGADRVHARGYRGANRSVAVLDTGIDRTHPAFANAVEAEACFSTTTGGTSPSRSLCPGGLDMSLLPGSAGPCPQSVRGCDHGTHVAGIVAGRAITHAGRNYLGVSPAARLVSVQVYSAFSNPNDCGGSAPCALSYPSDQLRALEWVFKKHQQYRIAAVNMSLSAGYFDQPCDDQSALTEIIERLRAKGILTVVAAGNEGYYDGVGMPGCISSAVTVSATTKAGPIDTSYSNIASFVDLAAPGTDILSAVPGSGYQGKSGTSMAAPHVAGAIALLREEYPNASADDLEAKLRTGAPSVTHAGTGVTLASLEVSHTLPAAGGALLAGVAAAPVEDPGGGPAKVTDTPGLVEQSFIIRTTGSQQRVASSVANACPDKGCDLKRISENAWKLDIPLDSPLRKDKPLINAEDVREAFPSLPDDAKIYSNIPAAPQ